MGIIPPGNATPELAQGGGPSSPSSGGGGQTMAPPCGSIQNGQSMWTNVPCKVRMVPTLDTDDTVFYEGAISDGIISQYLLDTEYHYDEHTLQMPVMSTETKAASFAVVSNETLKRIVNWKAEKTSVPPMMPDPDTNNPNEILLEKRFNPISIEVAADGVTLVYTLTGMYVYGIVDPTKATLYFGTLPYIEEDYDATELGQFDHGIIDSIG